MEEILIKSIKLENELTIKLFDGSRKIAGDRWFVSMIARAEVPININSFKGDRKSDISIDEIRSALGESVIFEQKFEKNFVDNTEKEKIINRQKESFISSVLPYISLPQFPQMYILKEFHKAAQKRSRF